MDKIKPLELHERKPIPKLFLSYSSKARTWARKLKNDLIQAGCHTWFDDDNILAGYPIILEIVRGIEESDAFILVWNKHASQSPWVSNEVLRALHKRASSPDDYLIIVLRRDNTPLLKGLTEYRWLRIKNSKDYNHAVKALLDSIAEKFGGYVFTAELGGYGRPRYRLQWVRSQEDSVEETKTPYNETLTIWDLKSGNLTSAMDVDGCVQSVDTLAGDFIISGLSPFGDPDDPDVHDLILWCIPSLTKARGTRIFGGGKYVWKVRTHPSSPILAVTGGEYGGQVGIYDNRLTLIKKPSLNAGISVTWVGTDYIAVPQGGPEDIPVIVDVQSGKVKSTLPWPGAHIFHITSDIAGRYIAFSGGDYNGGPGVFLVEAKSRKLIQRFSIGLCVQVSCVSPNGKLIAWTDKDQKYISIARIPSGKPLVTFIAHEPRSKRVS